MLAHAAKILPAVSVDTYNEELRDDEGFVGDRASGRAFRAILDDWRDLVREQGDDPFGDTATENIRKTQMDKMLAGDDPRAAGLVHTVIEEFAGELATVVRRFLRLQSWKGTESIVIGGGLSASHIGTLAIGRAGLILAGEGIEVMLRPIEHHPDEAGLVGAVQLAPSWVLAGHDAILAIDIGGTNLRVGVVELNLGRKDSLAKAKVWKLRHWRHADDEPTRAQTLKRLNAMTVEMIERAEVGKVRLAPFLGIACPGLIDASGRIRSGGQNLPGNWQDDDFHLPSSLDLPRIGGHEPVVMMHNDAVVQGLSAVPVMKSLRHWGVLTIGTGLGNARFSNHPREA
ncbi:MAG: ROK family protein [Alphaproteobacteria bacterium]|nr:ROK family protein [Alphaproteobacteria bacterium]MCW5738644.1 ROK family protein [Alphaproteobacteria bacterium]